VALSKREKARRAKARAEIRAQEQARKYAEAQAVEWQERLARCYVVLFRYFKLTKATFLSSDELYEWAFQSEQGRKTLGRIGLYQYHHCERVITRMAGVGIWVCGRVFNDLQRKILYELDYLRTAIVTREKIRRLFASSTLRKNLPRKEKVLGVYYLFSNTGGLLYVGSSVNVYRRVGEHRMCEWSKLYIEPCSNVEDMLDLEARKIGEFTPKYNIINRGANFQEKLSREPEVQTNPAVQHFIREFRKIVRTRGAHG
jgi:hypothetical protein